MQSPAGVSPEHCHVYQSAVTMSLCVHVPPPTSWATMFRVCLPMCPRKNQKRPSGWSLVYIAEKQAAQSRFKTTGSSRDWLENKGLEATEISVLCNWADMPLAQNASALGETRAKTDSF